MDPAIIAASVAALLVPYVKKAADEFAGEAGKYAWGKARALFARLTERLAGDRAARETLSQFERDPEGRQADMQAVIQQELETDPAFRDELAEMLAVIKRSAPQVRVVQRIMKAEEVVGAQIRRISEGTVDHQQDVGEAKRVIGPQIGDIGRLRD